MGEARSITPKDIQPGASKAFDGGAGAQPKDVQVSTLQLPSLVSEQGSQSVSRFPTPPRAGRLAAGVTALGVFAGGCGSEVDAIREEHLAAFDQEYTQVCQVDVPVGHTGQQEAAAHQAPSDVRERILFREEVDRMNPNADRESTDGPKPNDAENHVVIFPCRPGSKDQVASSVPAHPQN